MKKLSFGVLSPMTSQRRRVTIMTEIIIFRKMTKKMRGKNER